MAEDAQRGEDQGYAAGVLRRLNQREADEKAAFEARQRREQAIQEQSLALLEQLVAECRRSVEVLARARQEFARLRFSEPHSHTFQVKDDASRREVWVRYTREALTVKRFQAEWPGYQRTEQSSESLDFDLDDAGHLVVRRGGRSMQERNAVLDALLGPLLGVGD